MSAEESRYSAAGWGDSLIRLGEEMVSVEEAVRLLNEREKYRAALERIVRECHPGTHGEALMCIGDALAFAEEALKP